MDPLSHVALGRTLVGLADRRARGCAAATMLGALSPDLDALIMPLGWDRYLRAHEVGTHTIIGTVGCAILTAAVVRVFARASGFRSLLIFAWIGAASHVLLDLLSSARLRPAWPLADVVVTLPVVAMADPWLLALCLSGAIAVEVARRALRDADPTDLPRDAELTSRPSDARRHFLGWFSSEKKAAVTAIAAIGVFTVIKAVLGTSAFMGYRVQRDAVAQPVEARVIEAKWGSLNTWHVLDRTPEKLRFWHATAGKPAREVFSWPLEAETPVVHASRSFSTVRNFLRAHALGFAVALPQPRGGTLVLWSDIRFCRNPGGPERLTFEPIVESQSGADRIACGLWFGGEFAADSRPIRETVKIGRIIQDRDPSP
jgi:membrane-bound metal-dependent hydrolase YbcI (DUF457 family)